MKKLAFILMALIACPVFAEHRGYGYSGHGHNNYNSHHTTHSCYPRHDYSGFNLNLNFGNYPRGRYEIQYIRVWVPEKQIITYDTNGVRIIAIRPGYWEVRPVKVWVSY